MNWIEASPRERFQKYFLAAAEAGAERFESFTDEPSYFVPAPAGAADLDIYHNLNSPKDFVDKLRALWPDNPLPDTDILIRLVSAAALAMAPERRALKLSSEKGEPPKPGKERPQDVAERESLFSGTNYEF